MSLDRAKPMTREQRTWLRDYATRQAAVLRRVEAGLEASVDASDPVLIKVFRAIRAMEELGARPLRESVWPLYPARGAPLTEGQRAYLRGVAGPVKLYLEPVLRHFDRAGCPAPDLAGAVRRLHDHAGTVGIHLHYFRCDERQGRVPGHPPPPDLPAELCVGEGI